MFNKVSSKLQNKLNDLNLGSSSGGQQAHFSSLPVLGYDKASVYRHRLWRGVNLGSWFTLEKWISSKPFEGASGASDLDIASSKRSTQEKKQTLEQHWDTWVKEEDFWNLQSRGINTVRLPIGFYHLAGLDRRLLKDTEFEAVAEVYEGAWQRIQRAIQWADKYGIGVLLDLHSAPGCQNNDDHSGASHEARLFKSKKSQAQTLECLEALLKATFQIDNVVGLELLNEPAQHDKLKAFHIDSMNKLRAICGPEFPLIVSDSWNLSGGVRDYFPTTNFTVLDTHVYRCFTDGDRKMSAQEHAGKIKSDLAGQMQREVGNPADAGGRVIVGEWSGALNPDSFRGAQGGEQDAQRRQFVRAQLEVFEAHTSGYFYWTYRKQDGWDAGWCFKDALRAEVFPMYVGLKTRSNGPSNASQNHLQNALAQARGAHVNYWNNAVKGRQMEHWRFDDGFSVGFNDAVAFLDSQFNLQGGFASELPAAGGQWKVRRRAEHVSQKGDSEFTWIFEQAYDQGLEAAKRAWSST